MPASSNIQELIDRLKKVKQEIIDNRMKEVRIIASDVLALTKLRIQTTGVDYMGNEFEPYDPIYAKYGRDQYIDPKKRKGKRGQRRKNPPSGVFGTDIKDFKRTGRMWNSIKAFPVDNDENKAVVEIRASSPENKTKLNGQFKKHGNLLIPSKEELELALFLNRQRVLSKLNKL